MKELIVVGLGALPESDVCPVETENANLLESLNCLDAENTTAMFRIGELAEEVTQLRLDNLDLEEKLDKANALLHLVRTTLAAELRGRETILAYLDMKMNQKDA